MAQDKNICKRLNISITASPTRYFFTEDAAADEWSDAPLWSGSKQQWLPARWRVALADASLAVDRRPCHIVALPYPDRGDINPTLSLCRLLAVQQQQHPRTVSATVRQPLHSPVATIPSEHGDSNGIHVLWCNQLKVLCNWGILDTLCHEHWRASLLGYQCSLFP